MHQKNITIDIIGTRQEVNETQNRIIGALPSVSVRSLLTTNLNSYFHNAASSADIVIVNLSENALNDLKAIESTDLSDKKIIVIGDKNRVELLSNAISAGVSEFINFDDYQKQLLPVVNKLILSRSIDFNRNQKRKLNVVLNAKGGSGGSFIASNIAYMMSRFKDQEVALLDMDLQFGSVGLNFDISPKYTIVDALAEIKEIDYLSLDAYLTKYNNHLKLMLPSVDEIVLPGEIHAESVKSLLYLLQRNYNQIVIDLPRIIDPVFSMILEQADNIVVVVQQTLAQYRDGRRLIQVLNKDLDIPLEKVVVVINRYNPKSSLKKTDMINVVNHDHVFTIANDYIKVASASNLGEPLCQSSPKSKIAKDLTELAVYLGNITIDKKTGIGHFLRSIFGH